MTEHSEQKDKPRRPRLASGLPAYSWLKESPCFDAKLQPTGWTPLIESLLAEADEIMRGTGAVMEVLQVKEKLGSLRFYQRLHHASPEQDASVRSLIDRAYSASIRTCIVCGAEGSLRNSGGLLETVCRHHSQRKNDEQGRPQ